MAEEQKEAPRLSDGKDLVDFMMGNADSHFHKVVFEEDARHTEDIFKSVIREDLAEQSSSSVSEMHTDSSMELDLSSQKNLNNEDSEISTLNAGSAQQLAPTV